MTSLVTLAILLALSTLTHTRDLQGPCDFEDEGDFCNLEGNHEFEVQIGRPSYDYQAMTSGYSGQGFLLLKGYDSVSELVSPVFKATSGEEQVSFAYYINGDGESKSYVKLLMRSDGNEYIVYTSDKHGGHWHHREKTLNIAKGKDFQLVWQAKAHYDHWTTRHTWLGVDLISVTDGNPAVGNPCFRPPPIMYADPWSCSTDQQQRFNNSVRTEVPEGTVCTTQCQNGFLTQGVPSITCVDGTWIEEGTAPFMCIDNTSPEFNNCPEDVELTTPYGWGSMWYSVQAPQVTDNSNTWTLELYINDQLQENPSATYEAFPGTYRIEYKVWDWNGNENTCAYTVTIINEDQTPPKATFCPQSMTVDSSEPVMASWEEPIFTDDSGVVVKVESNYQQPTLLGWGQHDVIYTAYDNSSNSVTCTFTVTIRGLPCPPLSLPSFGALVCHDNYAGSFCTSMCGEDGDFLVASSELQVPTDYICSTSGTWVPYSLTYDCLKPYDSVSVMPPQYYFQGMCNSTEAQNLMKSQALSIFNNVDVDITLGAELTSDDFYVTCGPRQ